MKGMNPRDVTATILDLVKSEITEMMIRMRLLPVSMLQSLALRSSRRHMVVRDDVEILPASNL